LLSNEEYLRKRINGLFEYSEPTNKGLPFRSIDMQTYQLEKYARMYTLKYWKNV
jgi:hypothetical protein